MTYFLKFTIGKIKFATSIEEIKEITRPKEILQAKDLPPNFAGFFELRGEKIVLFDLPSFLGINSDESFEVIVSEIQKRPIGFKVNKVLGIVACSEIFPLPEIVRAKGYLKGIIKQNNELLQVISLSKLISGSRLNSLKKFINQS
uniref:CheW-like domain-containing protein n=1 Tax=candidate division WOR-3 bacterium TaxID=2052148 RepID=A0A7C4TAU7_UNCW3